MSGEFELIAAIRERLARSGAGRGSDALVLGSGDDAAIAVRAGASATSVDIAIEGVHFRAPPFSARQVGHKALAAALSDLAAMGATGPGEAYVQLGVPADRAEGELLELADGFGELAARHAFTIAGGDLSRAPVLVVAVTVVGVAAAADALVHRSGARPGDLLVVTGELGGAAAGLLLSERPALAARLDRRVAAALTARQREPEPRLGAGRALAEAGATAMIDVSDGLGADAAHLAADAAIEVDLGRLPVQRGVAEVAAAAGRDPLDLAASGGEDYELLAAIPALRLEPAEAAVAASGSRLTVIGAVGSGAGVTLRGPGGTRAPGGFDQLRPPRAPGPRAPADPA